ncbi:MAG: histidine kinase [Cyclobacteriaceae bacterium]|nr:histidine kinase [Cyclobacteriaceae bacterium]
MAIRTEKEKQAHKKSVISLPNLLGYRSWRTLGRAYAIIVGVCLLGFAVRVLAVDKFSVAFQFNLFLLTILVSVIGWEFLRNVNSLLDRAYPYSRNVTIRIILQLSLGTVYGIVTRIIIYHFGEPRLPFYVDELFLKVTWVVYVALPGVVNLGFFTAYFISRWKESLVRVERLEKEKAQVQFDNLKNQLNPHFLFNALASLNSLILEDQHLASRFLQHLSKVYRYVLQHKEQNLVSLQTELDFIRNYIFLAETRFSKALSIQVTVKPEDATSNCSGYHSNFAGECIQA